ncbi:NAD(P)H-dependent oxidoreductase [Rhizobium lentis]|uniref:NAD(P)H-dependent oxidoreductase n=1 Tax=Rhizobium lentis TaxID=1138194 RepID=UPI001C832E44|nr:NAD(P)H-dependent oxidoreductase [Rhizobium lentis]MBX5177264.1 NAD(P)H-dependent oxidoreductase [Rhizobium lentis]
MHAHIVHVHPELSSYNAAMTRSAQQALSTCGHTVTIHDLYRTNFDPVERGQHYSDRSNAQFFSPLAEQRHASRTCSLPHEIQSEIGNLERADLVILQFPLWWHGPPAILKGWMDRVFVNGGLYSGRMRYDTGYFRRKLALVSVTTGAPRDAFGPGSRGGDLDVMLWPIQYSLHYVGFTILPPFVSYGVQGHGYSYEDEFCQRERLVNNLTQWRSRLTCLDEALPLEFPGWNDWDDEGRAIR